MYNRELELIFAFSDTNLIEPKNWERLCAVFWIRGMDYLFSKNNNFEKHIRESVAAGNIPSQIFPYMYSLAAVTELTNEIRKSPLFDSTLLFQNGTIHVLTDLFLWSVLVHNDCSFGNGFGGHVGMIRSRLDF
jgi:hypothetical protein